MILKKRLILHGENKERSYSDVSTLLDEEYSRCLFLKMVVAAEVVVALTFIGTKQFVSVIVVESNASRNGMLDEICDFILVFFYF